MARIPYLEQSDIAPQDRDVLVRPFHLWQALANAPAASRQFQAMVNYIWNDCGLERRHVELAILQIGYLTRTEYEWVHHIRLSLQHGVESRDILAIGDETAGRATHLAEAERLILRAARETVQQRAVSNATFEALRAHFDHNKLTNLVLTMAFYNGVAILLQSLQIAVEDEHRHVLQQYPFASVQDAS